MFEKGPGVYHGLVRKIAKRRKDNGVIMTGNVWIEFGTYLNTRRQFATWWYMQTQRNVCGSSVHLNIEKCLAANYFSCSADKLWPNCQLLKLWYPPQPQQMGCVCSRTSQETSYFGITAVGWSWFATTVLTSNTLQTTTRNKTPPSPCAFRLLPLFDLFLGDILTSQLAREPTGIYTSTRSFTMME